MVCGLNIWPEGGHWPMVDLGGDVVGGGWYPKSAMWMEAKDNPPPDFDRMHGLNVSEKAKQIIEQLEPGVHEFFPVEYLDREGHHLENRYWFAVGNCIDSLDRERSNLVLVGANWVSPKNAFRINGSVPSTVDVDRPPSKVFNLKAIGTAKIWRDEYLDGGPWLTDDAARTLEAKGLSGIRLEIGESEAV